MPWAFTMRSTSTPKRSALRFFALTVVLFVPFWVLGFLVRVPGLPMSLPLSALGTFCPLAAAVILTRRAGSPGGTRQLLLRVIDAGRLRSWAWLLPIMLVMPAVMFLSFLTMRLMGSDVPVPHARPLAVPLLLVTYFVAAVGEEVGWTAYATDALQARRSALTTAFIVGGMWVACHLVGFWQAHHSASWLAWQSLVTVALRIIMVWLYDRSGGSLFGIILFHATINLSVALFPVAGSYYDPAVTAIIVLAIAVGLVPFYTHRRPTRAMRR